MPKADRDGGSGEPIQQFVETRIACRNDGHLKGSAEGSDDAGLGRGEFNPDQSAIDRVGLRLSLEGM